MSSKTINTILNLQDKMSPKLIKVSSRVKSLDKDTQRATQKMANMANKWSSSVDKMVSKAGKLTKVGATIAAAGATAAGAYAIKGSDTYSGIQARLKLINDGQQTVAEFNKKIFKSAYAARVPYEDIASTIGKLGILAGSAFKDNDEILKFSELMAKNFKIAGASAEEQSAGMYQLTQAMASGRLQGDEFRSILENAPLLAQAIAKEMDMPMGKLKEASKDGIITADVIKAALFNSADEIDKRYKQIPKTFNDVAVQLKNKLNENLQPTFEKMSKWLNSKEGENAINKATQAIERMTKKLPAIAKAFQRIYKAVKKVFSFIIKHQDIILFFGTFVLSLVAVTKAIAITQAAVKALGFAFSIVNGAFSLTPAGKLILILSALIAVGVLVYKNWDKIKESISKAWAWFKKLIDGIPDVALVLTGPLAPLLLLIKHFDKVKKAIKGAWKWLKKFFKADSDSKNSAAAEKETTYQARTGRNALGTSYWKGGLTSINEHGREIIDLPNGSRVIPADKSKSVTNNRKASFGDIIIYAKGTTADEVINEIVPKLKLTLANI